MRPTTGWKTPSPLPRCRRVRGKGRLYLDSSPGDAVTCLGGKARVMLTPRVLLRRPWLKLFSAARGGQRGLLLRPRYLPCPWDAAPQQQWETSQGEASGRRRLEECLLCNELF